MSLVGEKGVFSLNARLDQIGAQGRIDRPSYLGRKLVLNVLLESSCDILVCFQHILNGKYVPSIYLMVLSFPEIKRSLT